MLLKGLFWLERFSPFSRLEETTVSTDLSFASVKVAVAAKENETKISMNVNRRIGIFGISLETSFTQVDKWIMHTSEGTSWLPDSLNQLGRMIWH